MPRVGYTSLSEQNDGAADPTRRKDNSVNSANETHPSVDVVDTSTRTRQACIAVLALMWLIGLGVVVVGAVAQRMTDKSSDGMEPSTYHHKSLVPFLQLAVSFVVTGLSDVAGLVHSTSLRFTLLSSGRLAFNSNLRLFTSCKSSRIHWWPINVIWAWSLISSYACGSMIVLETVYSFSDTNPDGTIGPSHSYDIVSGYALIFLGLGLLGQASIATWALAVNRFPTWSTNPIQIGAVCQSQGWLSRVPGRSMASVHEVKQTDHHEHAPALPKTRQRCMLEAHFRFRRVLMIAWTVTLVAFLWFAAISVAYQLKGDRGPAWGSFSRSYTNDWSLIPDWVDTTAFLAIPTSLGHSYFSFGPWFLCKYLLTCAFLGGITLNLHIVELVVQASRDESLWRQTATATGLALAKHGAFYTAVTSWQTVGLFVFKGLLHWMFGLMFGLMWEGIEVRIPQACYTAILLFALAAMATAIAIYRPKGPQPATFGHLQTLVDVIDVWPCRQSDPVVTDAGSVDGQDKMASSQVTEQGCTLYWGDKGDDGDGVRHAGTDLIALKPIVMTATYR
ncbi:hypothetical protein A1O1_04796 [Capronia coronata CBS 617.96]|uniref:Uncharacterized protein n=1 Tax=Capronia coronata CBS 617.96 TaxID=1182541 RepID=W9Z027_9EURO|nr:uncharacterized protein A1O1_04796 [Capronia coronata CBS 617.96]EXJ87869.1 hypothetical protein A1O1_04796 [Capronia coronata CBS 617.96]